MDAYIKQFLEQAKNRYERKLADSRFDEVAEAYNFGAIDAIEEMLEYVLHNYGNTSD
jgi:hypothetical protein